MKKIDAKMDLPKLEEEILDFWDDNKIFRKSLDNRKNAECYSFYDGPPFATGTPHYGHIVPSTVKDVIPRYWTMSGRYVPRVWGWDCHGLPIENIAEKDLGLTNKKDIEKIGIEKFNDYCRSKVLSYVDEWKTTIRRLGRWVDMDNAYKTMDRDYMESVWWVFKSLWDKGLIYEDYRSMHVCPRCETTLSQSEVAEGYQTVKDLSAIAEFELIDEPNTFLLAWTTTPWTLIGNVALAVGDKIKYLKIEKKDQETGELIGFILAKDRLTSIFGDEEYKIVAEFPGSELSEKKYKPLFSYYSNDEKLENRNNGWKIVTADFISILEGTGIVHIAPAFGEDDLNLGRKLNLPFVQHVGMDGVIKKEAGEFAGMLVKPRDDHFKTDVEIIKYLANENVLFSKEKYEHSYPFCWRCDTPLINYATSSWFVKVTQVKESAIERAKEIGWFPTHIKKGRFGKWLEGAHDWSISRQRFWASVLPIWKCECGEVKVFGSIAELEELCGQKVDDLHKHVVDKVTVPCDKCQGVMKRVPDVLDTWFDSGSMPYAEKHYPFENKNEFNSTFPADFIGEGVDQTRAWFYYLHIIACAIFDQPAYKNVIASGIVLASDGKKMSKRLKNYPDPMEMFDKYGADVMRYYLLSSPVVAAENLNFLEKEMEQISRGVFRMLWNSYSFLTTYASLDNWQGETSDYKLSQNILDKWMVSKVERVNDEIISSMNKYDLPRSIRNFSILIDNLSNWYIRRSRKRFWKSENDDDKTQAYNTLNYVLTKISLLLAPFCPFISEEIFKNLTGKESVHLEDYPKPNRDWIDQELESKMDTTRGIVESLLAIREVKGIKVRQPLGEANYSGDKLNQEFENIIAEETNVKQVKYTDKIEKGEIGHDGNVSLDIEINRELSQEGMVRDIIREIQIARKEFGFDISDRISLYYQASAEIKAAVERFSQLLCKEILANAIEFTNATGQNSKKIKISGEELTIVLEKQ